MAFKDAGTLTLYVEEMRRQETELKETIRSLEEKAALSVAAAFALLTIGGGDKLLKSCLECLKGTHGRLGFSLLVLFLILMSYGVHQLVIFHTFRDEVVGPDPLLLMEASEGQSESEFLLDQANYVGARVDRARKTLRDLRNRIRIGALLVLFSVVVGLCKLG